jgi:hypothetical protein
MTDTSTFRGIVSFFAATETGNLRELPGFISPWFSQNLRVHTRGIPIYLSRSEGFLRITGITALNRGVG